MFDSAASTPSERIKKMTEKAQLDPKYLACESERIEQVRKKPFSEMSEEGKKKYRKKCDDSCKV